MTTQEVIDEFLDRLLENAIGAYSKTDQGIRYREKLEQMDRDCEMMLTKEDQSFAVECFELLLEAEGEEQTFAYRRAFQDCVAVLKALRILS